MERVIIKSGKMDNLNAFGLRKLARHSMSIGMSIENLKRRFKMFAIGVAALIRALPRNTVDVPYSGQLVRSSSSSAANYWAACRAKSTPDFINKLKIVEEELDESILFLELLQHFNPEFDNDFNCLVREANELLAITVTSIKTARFNTKQGPIPK